MLISVVGTIEIRKCVNIWKIHIVLQNNRDFTYILAEFILVFYWISSAIFFDPFFDNKRYIKWEEYIARYP